MGTIVKAPTIRIFSCAQQLKSEVIHLLYCMVENEHIGRFGILNSFIQHRMNRLIMLGSLVIVVCIAIVEFSIPDFHVVPGEEDFVFDFYTDSANGGQSKFLNQLVSDTAVVLDFELNEGFLSPYVGLSIRNKAGNPINLGRYHRFAITLEGRNLHNLGISLFTNQKGIQTRDNNTLCFQTTIETVPGINSYTRELSRLKMPDWWVDYNNLASFDRIKPDFSNVRHINIGTAYTPLLNHHHTLIIHSFVFTRDHRKTVVLLTFSETLLLLALFFVHWVRSYFNRKKETVTIEYKSVEVEKKDRPKKDFIDYISRNFHDCELSLDQVAAHSGLPQRQITQTINQTFGCNFKSYINGIRINESKKLLLETKLNIGEIAFKVGFGNQSHFNRVFKTIVGISPSEYRNGKNL